MKWFATIFVSLLFFVLSFNAFVQNDLGRSTSGGGNKIMALFTAIYGWLVGKIGFIPTGVVFAVAGIGIIILAIRDGRKAKA